MICCATTTPGPDSSPMVASRSPPGYTTRCGRTRLTAVMTRELIDTKPDAAGFINGIKWRAPSTQEARPEICSLSECFSGFLGINMKSPAAAWISLTDGPCRRPTISQRFFRLPGTGTFAIFQLERWPPRWMFPELGQIDANAKRNERLHRWPAC